MKKKIVVAKSVSIPKNIEKKYKKKPGGSNTGKYKNISAGNFAGRAGATSPYSFPINTITRARNALARAHYAPNPSGIRRAVYAKYPSLRPVKIG